MMLEKQGLEGPQCLIRGRTETSEESRCVNGGETDRRDGVSEVRNPGTQPLGLANDRQLREARLSGSG